MAENTNLEGLMQEIDVILKEIENDNTSLEKAFDLYKNGMEKVKACNDIVKKVEQEVTIIESSMA
ncbi:MAG: exodeoxyribonuclease VII small subunit [Lachnospiraceae bacterium]|nr:exodeoxyribonuclease VII small subunit [Lachnospiraceae bacterium]